MAYKKSATRLADVSVHKLSLENSIRCGGYVNSTLTNLQAFQDNHCEVNAMFWGERSIEDCYSNSHGPHGLVLVLISSRSVNSVPSTGGSLHL